MAPKRNISKKARKKKGRNKKANNEKDNTSEATTDSNSELDTSQTKVQLDTSQTKLSQESKGKAGSHGAHAEPFQDKKKVQGDNSSQPQISQENTDDGNGKVESEQLIPTESSPADQPADGDDSLQPETSQENANVGKDRAESEQIPNTSPDDQPADDDHSLRPETSQEKAKVDEDRTESEETANNSPDGQPADGDNSSQPEILQEQANADEVRTEPEQIPTTPPDDQPADGDNSLQPEIPQENTNADKDKTESEEITNNSPDGQPADGDNSLRTEISQEKANVDEDRTESQEIPNNSPDSQPADGGNSLRTEISQEKANVDEDKTESQEIPNNSPDSQPADGDNSLRPEISQENANMDEDRTESQEIPNNSPDSQGEVKPGLLASLKDASTKVEESLKEASHVAVEGVKDASHEAEQKLKKANDLVRKVDLNPLHHGPGPTAKHHILHVKESSAKNGDVATADGKATPSAKERLQSTAKKVVWANRVTRGLSTLASDQHLVQKKKKLDPISKQDDMFSAARALQLGVQELASSRDYFESDAYDSVWELQFQDIIADSGEEPFDFKAYCPEAFRNLRQNLGIEEGEYLASIGGLSEYRRFTSNSQSGSFFCVSNNGKYMIKTIHPPEAQSLMSMLYNYHHHLVFHPKSLLMRIYGLYHITIPCKQISGYFLVSGGIFNLVNDQISTIYDLKGSEVGRAVGPNEKPNAPLKDLDLIHSERKFCLGSGRSSFMDSLAEDSEFLRQQNVMDYSLLVGISYPKSDLPQPPSGDNELDEGEKKAEEDSKNSSSNDIDSRGTHGELLDEHYHIGIIDILTPYSAAKFGETVFKSLLNFGRRDKIAAVNPDRYAERFKDFIDSVVV